MSKIAKNTFLFSIGTLFSRILGFAREIVFTFYLGASLQSDIFFATFRIPNFLRVLLAEGTLSFAYINVFTDMEKENKKEAMKMSSAFLNIIFFITTFLYILVLFFSEEITTVLLPGFDVQKIQLSSWYLKWIFPFIILISASSVFTGYLNIREKFFLPALTPVFLNIFLIGGVVLFITEDIYKAGIVFGLSVLLAGITQLTVLGIQAYKNGFEFYSIFFHKGIKEMIFYFIPGTFAMAITQINVLVDNIFASYLPQGGISWLYYGNRLVQFPMGIFGIAIATVMTPYFASNKNNKNLQKGIATSFKLNSILMFPCMLGLMFFAYPIIELLFLRGEFTQSDCINVSRVLIFYSIGLWFYSGLKIVKPYFYSVKKLYVPVLSAFIALTANTFLNWILMYRMGADGLALATSLSAILNFMFLCFFIQDLNFLSLKKFFYKFLIIIIIFAFMLYLLQDFNLLFSIVISSLIYLFLLYIFKIDEVDYLFELFVKNKKKGIS
ncbi:MAG: murein biosynthesis integral membrane protein MurJ [Candidatus Muiribacteriota bacterium]